MCTKLCKYYVYLDHSFTTISFTSISIKTNSNLRICHDHKFISFCHKNNDIPFYVKMKVFNAAVMSHILYG